MRILISGGVGFLGSHLVDLLLTDPACEVHVVDSFAFSPLPLARLHEENPAWHRVVVASMTIQEYGDAYLSMSSPPVFDEIYHLASVVGPAGVLAHGGNIALSILQDTRTMIGLARMSRCSLIDVSTSEVYGGGEAGVCSERMSSRFAAGASPRREYAVGKLAAEIMLQNMVAAGVLDARIVRPFNIAGPRQSGRGGFVLPRFLLQGMAAQPMTIFGDGSARRSFTDVRDVARALMVVAAAGTPGSVYNVGNAENACTIQQLAREVRELTGSPASPVFVDPVALYGPGYEEAADKLPVAERLIRLGWSPHFSRAEILTDTLAFDRALPEALLMSMMRAIALSV